MQGKNVIDCATAASILTFFPVNICLYFTVFLYPATQKVVGYYVKPSEPFECPFVRPSELPFRTLTWVVFDRFSSNFAWTLISGRSGLGWQWAFFVNFEQHYGPCLMSDFFLCPISCELICGFRSNFVYALILTKCRHGMIEQYVSFIFNRVMALDWYQYFIYAQYLVDQLMDFDKIL